MWHVPHVITCNHVLSHLLLYSFKFSLYGAVLCFSSRLTNYNFLQNVFQLFLLFVSGCFLNWQGTTYVYSTFLRPFVANHEREIDRHLNELRTRAGDLAFQYWQRGSVYAQSRFMEVLQYVASQSPSTPQQGSMNSQKVSVFNYGCFAWDFVYHLGFSCTTCMMKSLVHQ